MHLFVCFILISGRFVFCLEEDYYWREYTGTIPEDAIIGGRDINNKNIYIGQAFVAPHGLLVSTIIPGIKSVEAPTPSIGVKKVETYIKILCGRQENFYWSQTNATSLHLHLIENRPVIGGHETGGILYIGRIYHEGNVKIGKVVGFIPGSAIMYFPHKGNEMSIMSYEILLYNGQLIDVRIED